MALMNGKLLEEERDDFIKQRAFLDDFVLPDYETFNVKNIASIVGRIYGANSLATAKFPDEYVDDFDGVEKVFLMIVDGLGYNRFLTHVKNHGGVLAELAEKGVSKPLTSTFPATTSTSLASIFTGLSPAEHNLLGYLMFSREYGCVFNTLDMKPIFGYSSHVEIAKDFARKMKPWMPELQEHGVRTLVATKGSIVGSGLSRVTHADTEVVPYMLDSEMMVKCKKALEQHGRVFLMLYYSGIDTLEHRYGPNSEEVTSEIQAFEYHLNSFLSKLSDATKKQTLIILTADHGVSETNKVYYVKDYPEITNSLLLPPVGDSRAAFLFSKPRQSENLKNAFETDVDGFKLVPSKELIDKGAFGSTEDSTLLEAAVGDFTALSKGANALQYPYFDDDRTREQRGGHGGMTAEEVVVPLLSVRLSKV
jgi:hypothetical protein